MNQDLNFWIVNDWGGIKSFKRNGKNIAKILAFEKHLIRKRLSRSTFETISSLSKVAAFIDPINYVIYDSRAVYSMNWLIMTTRTEGLRFFPIPPGRNKLMIDFDLHTIINLSHLKEYKNGLQLYYSYQEAYFTFCGLIKMLAEHVFGNHCRPYLLEMLLFKIFEEEVLEEIGERINLSISYG